MSPRKLPKRSVAIAVMFIFVVLSACVRPPGSGVNVKALAADLVFGVPQVAEPVAPPNIDVAPAEELGIVTDSEFRDKLKAPATTPAVACPSAEFGAAAPLASTTLQGIPKEGTYRWKAEGYERYNFGSVSQGERVTQPGTFISHAVTVQKVGSDSVDFRYTTVQRELKFGGVTTRLVYEVTNSGGTADGPGLYLTEITQNPGPRQQTFKMNPRLQLMGFPVGGGQLISSKSVNSENFDVLEIEGLVLGKRRRLDACGDVIDAWEVDATAKFTYSQAGSDSTSSTREVTYDWDYAVWTNQGALIVWEHTESPPCEYDHDGNPTTALKEARGADGKCTSPHTVLPNKYLEFTTSIGQLEPA